MADIEQITDTTLPGESFFPSINADGTLIAFDSSANINMGNPEGNREIWLFDSVTGITTQITDQMGGGEDSLFASINADGTRIAFDSDADIDMGNPDGSREVYLFDTLTGMFTQITDGPFPTLSRHPSINAVGTLIAFDSNANINGTNMDGSREIWLYNTVTGMTMQITDETAGASSEPSINADGTRIAFHTTSNIDMGNPDGNFEIYVFDTVTGMFTQITFTTGGFNFQPSINADGTRITFESTSDIDMGNPDGNREIWLFDTITGMFTQITDTMAGASFQAYINADGTRIAFNSSADIDMGNPEGNREIYVFDTITGIFTQITDEMAGTGEYSSINADGTRIAFYSTADINGGNLDGNREVYLAVCFNQAPPLLSPTTATNDLLTNHTVIATIDTNGTPEPDVLVTFEVISGPNAGLLSMPNNGECSPNDCATDGNGQVSWTYSSVIPGTDIIEASFVDMGDQVIESNLVEKIWVSFVSLSPATATNDTGTDHTVTATVEIDGIPEQGGFITFEVISGPNAGLMSMPNNGKCTPNDDCTTDANGQVSWTYRGGKVPGTDTIVASFFDEEFQVSIESNLVEKIWESIPIPTLSQWGLIAMAGILGIIGFMVLRKRKVTA